MNGEVSYHVGLLKLGGISNQPQTMPFELVWMLFTIGL